MGETRPLVDKTKWLKGSTLGGLLGGSGWLVGLLLVVLLAKRGRERDSAEGQAFAVWGLLDSPLPSLLSPSLSLPFPYIYM